MSDLELNKSLQRGDKGGQVKLIQEWLSLHGEHVGIDGDFGPATLSAVLSFQNKSELPSTGIVDVKTFEKLIAPMQAALRPIQPNNLVLGELVVAYAKQHLAQHPCETGGQNMGPWVRLYMNGEEGTPWAWCAGFVSFCLKNACNTLGVPLPIRTSFSVDQLAASAKQVGRFIDQNGIKPGSFFLVRKSPTDWIHTGIVVSAAAETFQTIEGNTNDDGSREGYEVCARTRAYGKTDFILI